MFKAPGTWAFFSAETENLSGKQKTYRCIILQELCLMRNGKEARQEVPTTAIYEVSCHPSFSVPAEAEEEGIADKSDHSPPSTLVADLSWSTSRSIAAAVLAISESTADHCFCSMDSRTAGSVFTP